MAVLRAIRTAKSTLGLATALAAAGLLSTFSPVPNAMAQDQAIKIGVIYDFTGPFAAGGSEAAAIGTQIAIDMVNEQGGVEGYKITPGGRRCPVQGRGRDRRGRAPAQPGERRPDHGRLLERPLRAARPEGRRRRRSSCGPTSASPRRCSRTRTCKYVFRPQVHSDQFGWASCSLPQGEQRGEARHRARGAQGRDHLRGRALRLGRRRGQRGQLRRVRHGDRAQGGLCGDRAGPLEPGHQAAPGAARRDPAHRLQPRHHAVPAPGQGAGPEVQGADRPRRRLRPDRQADRDLRRGRQLRLQRRSGGGAAARPERPWRPAWAS